MESRSRIYGVVGEFETPRKLIQAANKARVAGYKQMDAYTPFPGEGLSEALGLKRSLVPLVTLTGGLLAGALTDVPGASAVFLGGVVAYATELKAVLLGVDRAVLAVQGAVSAEVAEAMATGVRGRLGATVGAATTGVAGPDPAEGKPAGTVYIAASAGDKTRVRQLALSGSRAAIRAETVREALRLVLVTVREES